MLSVTIWTRFISNESLVIWSLAQSVEDEINYKNQNISQWQSLLLTEHYWFNLVSFVQTTNYSWRPAANSSEITNFYWKVQKMMFI